ncbi:4Fe-4S binding domain-containing protein [Salisediminibacterium halotolerans]|uniref:4Fe-4S binding domain-containing protein n=2 Tax=Salisediminibacterium halotolerans TaxID=517425 RepID=A0A1H9UGZ8_9BACI|nr:4Fe-4S binding domain-containing protein [Salisediminibacterium haloalkalitolerans]
MMLERFLFKRIQERTMIRISESRCLRQRHKENACTACVDECPHNALEIDGRAVKFNSEQCRDCHFCVHVCPTDAVFYEAEMMSKYERRILHRDKVTFTCREQADSDGNDVVLPCLKWLSPEWLMMTELHNKVKEVYCDPGICSSCSVSWDPEEGLSWLKDWNRLTYTADTELIDKAFDKSGKKRAYNRRELFQMTSVQTKQEIGDLFIDSYTEEPSLQKKIPQTEKQTYAAAYLYKVDADSSENDADIAKRMTSGEISLKAPASSWDLLTAVCPTGAIIREDTVDRADLYADPSRCVACDICSLAAEEVPIKSLDTVGKFSRPILLQTLEMDDCPACGGKKERSRTKCPDCEMKEEKKRALLADW